MGFGVGSFFYFYFYFYFFNLFLNTFIDACFQNNIMRLNSF